MRPRNDKENVGTSDLGVIELTESESDSAKPSIPRRTRKRARKVPASASKEEEGLQDPPRKHPKLDATSPKREPEALGEAENLDAISLSRRWERAPKQEVKEEEQPRHRSTTNGEADLSPSPGMKVELLPHSLDELRLAVSKLSNPKAEVKEEIRLDADTVLNLLPHDALQPYPISLPEKLRSVTVTRLQLSKRYGGSPVDTFPQPSAKKVAEHGYSSFMCIRLDWNPNGPQVPGHGGLFFKVGWPANGTVGWSGADQDSSPVEIVFVRLGSNRWLYLGEYEMTAAPALTAAQWCALPNKVRNCWTKNLSKKGWATTLRARIHLRRTLGREPTQEEVDGADTRKEKYDHIQPDTIDDAFVAGEECIETWSMKCVGYDEDFQKALIDLTRRG